MAQKPFPEIKKKNRGKFTRWVKKNKKSLGTSDTCTAADKVMAAEKGQYSDEVREMANYAKNFGCSTKK